ncbi:MAG: hemolysin III family protein [Lactobacillaceae bacterium]|jgi:hemolysin III|nr:hemolysin III family protein [Lactobacillaceae bacterium]
MQPNHMSKRYLITFEVLNAVTHGLGVIGAIIAAVFLIHQSLLHHFSGYAMWALGIYIFGIISFLLASTLFHSLIFTKAAKLFQFFDHSLIYFVILGTYTPYTWLFLHNALGFTIWGTLAFLTVAGIIYDLFFVGRFKWLSVTIYLVMGWMIILVVPMLWTAIPHSAFWLLFAGGITYSVGTIFYMLPKIPMGHVWWHLFVLVATGLMFASIYITLF